MLYAICYMLYAICYMLDAIYMLYATCYMLYAICYMLYAICYYILAYVCPRTKRVATYDDTYVAVSHIGYRGGADGGSGALEQSSTRKHI